MKKNLSMVLCAMMLMMCMPLSAFAQETMTYADTIEWDAEYDVVVVGFGGSGGASAIAAAEAGATVLLTEKAPRGHEGGNSKYSGQYILDYHDYETGMAYLRAECEGYDNMTEEIMDYIVRETQANNDWIVSLGMNPIQLAIPVGEYPELPGADKVKTGSITGETSIPGRSFWGSIYDGVGARQDKIAVWYESPAKHLIQDPFTKTIIGVEIEYHGEMVNVRAHNGVVLATGGFENNEDMIENYIGRTAVYPVGSVYNTGDGLTMALEVNAQLWHTANMSGPFLTVKQEGNEQAFWNSMSQNMFKDSSAIYVGEDGTRFTDESGLARHGHVSYSGTFLPQITPHKMYAIFDEQARLAGTNINCFSADLSEEIEAGIVVKADTIAELAEKLGLTEDFYDVNVGQSFFERTYYDAGLVGTVERYNSYCEAGYDPECNRNPATMRKLENGPFYAVELAASLVNTQGGPRRNTKCEVLDTENNPIPHLYSAGELGSFYGGYYTAGGNLAEALFTGRTAGTNAAAEKEPLPALELKAVESEMKVFESEFGKGEVVVDIEVNEYVGVGQGINGDVVVKLTIVDGLIENVIIVSHNETPSIGGEALGQLKNLCTGYQGVDKIDNISGATITCNAFFEAVREAQAQYIGE